MRTPTGDGLQAARTALSWRRTVASAGAAGALLAHHAVVREHGWTATLLLMGVVAGPLGLSMTAWTRHRTPRVTAGLVRLTAGIVALLALLALAAG